MLLQHLVFAKHFPGLQTLTQFISGWKPHRDMVSRVCQGFPESLRAFTVLRAFIIDFNPDWLRTRFSAPNAMAVTASIPNFLVVDSVLNDRWDDGSGEWQRDPWRKTHGHILEDLCRRCFSARPSLESVIAYGCSRGLWMCGSPLSRSCILQNPVERQRWGLRYSPERTGGKHAPGPALCRIRNVERISIYRSIYTGEWRKQDGFFV